GLTAVSEVDISIDEGEIAAIIGPNGAGKTTLFNMISGVYKPDAGKLVFNGKDITGLGPEQIAPLGISRTFQNILLFAGLTALENVLVGMHTRLQSGLLPSIFMTKAQRDEELAAKRQALALLTYVGLRDAANELA